MGNDRSALIEVTVDDRAWSSAVTGLEEFVQKTVQSALSACTNLPNQPHEVSVLLTSDAAVQELNKRYRDQDKPTNVLSFPGFDPDVKSPGPVMLGDVVVAFGTANREAGEENKALASHVAHLLVHGTLHLLGYDHEDDAQAAVMENQERHILAQLGYADPYEANREAV